MSNKTFELDEALLKGLYRTAREADRTFLENKYGKEFFTQKITDKIKTYLDAYDHLGKDPSVIRPFKNPSNARERFLNAACDLDIISEALLDGAILDWSKSNQKKWWPWFNNYSPGSGFRFVGSDLGWTISSANGGARLCLDTKEKSDYFGNQFLDIWNDFLNPIK